MTQSVYMPVNECLYVCLRRSVYVYFKVFMRVTECVIMFVCSVCVDMCVTEC